MKWAVVFFFRLDTRLRSGSLHQCKRQTQRAIANLVVPFRRLTTASDFRCAVSFVNPYHNAYHLSDLTSDSRQKVTINNKPTSQNCILHIPYSVSILTRVFFQQPRQTIQTSMASLPLPSNVHVSQHPCLRAKLSQLRSKSANARETKALVHEIALILGCEALASGLQTSSSGTVSLSLSGIMNLLFTSSGLEKERSRLSTIQGGDADTYPTTSRMNLP